MMLWIYAGLSIGIFTVVVLLITSITKNRNNFWLALSAFSIWYLMLITVLNQNGAVAQYPHLLRTGNVFAYLIYPFLYVFAYNSFYPPGKWHLHFTWLLIPALVYIIDLLPFFLLPGSEKLNIMAPLLQNRDERIKIDQGWIAIPYLHAVLRYVWSFVVLLLLLRLLYRNYYLQSQSSRLTNRVLFRIVGALTLAYIPLLLIAAANAIARPTAGGFQWPLIIMSASLVGLAFCVQLFPGILYGLSTRAISSNSTNGVMPDAPPDVPENQPSAILVKNASLEKNTLSEADEKHLALTEQAIRQVMDEKRLFVRPSYSIHDLASDSGVPAYLVSWLLNRHVGQNFSQFVNEYRVRFFEEICQHPENQNLTLEALAYKAGFASRSTFINAFKKVHGITPKEFVRLKQIEG